MISTGKNENTKTADEPSGDDVSSTTSVAKSKVSTNFSSKETDVIDHPFKQSNETSDLRLVVEGRPLYVSRVVLSLVSPVLKGMLQTRATEDTIELPLTGQKYTEMVQFLCCIYPDILAPLNDKTIEVVLRLADDFQVQRLIENCEEYLTKNVEITTPSPSPEKIVRYLYISDKYGLERLQKAAFEAAARTQSDVLENVREFWELPSVTTTSVFIKRLKLLEKHGQNVRSKIKEVHNHCSLYHKGERNIDSVCAKCNAAIGKYVQAELKNF